MTQFSTVDAHAGNPSNSARARKRGLKILTGGRLPVLAIARIGGAMELVAFPVSENRDSDRHEHGWNYEHEDSAAQTLNDAGSGRGCLRVAEGATLGVGSGTERDGCGGGEAKPKGGANRRFSKSRHHLAAHFPNGLMRRRRKLSDQIMFIMSMTKIVAGINARRRLRCSFRRCMKYITPRPAWMKATASMRSRSWVPSVCW